MLSTEDGGQTWNSRGNGDTVKQFSFFTLNDGIAEVGGNVSLTSDGGEHWQRINVPQMDPKIQPPYVIESVAALTSMSFAFELHKDNVEEVVYATNDAGHTWTPVHLTNIIARTIIPHDGEFWDFGIEYLGREHNPGGGYGVAVALHSKDGVHWDHGVRATNEFDGCNSQSCYLRYGVLEDVYGAQEKIWSLPEDDDLSRKWAMVGDTVCMVDHEVRCGKAIPSPSPQSMPDRSSFSSVLGDKETIFAGCLDCHFDNIPKPQSLRGRGGMIRGATVKFTVNRNGRVSAVVVKDVPIKELEKQIAKQVSEWVIEPRHNAGTAVETQENLKIDILCFPDLQNSNSWCSVRPSGKIPGMPQ